MLNSSTCVDVRRVSTGKIYLFSVQLNACIMVPSVLYTSTAEARAPLVAEIQKRARWPGRWVRRCTARVAGSSRADALFLLRAARGVTSGYAAVSDFKRYVVSNSTNMLLVKLGT